VYAIDWLIRLCDNLSLYFTSIVAHKSLRNFNFKFQDSVNSPKFQKSNSKPLAVWERKRGDGGERGGRESFLVVILTQRENPKLGNRPICRFYNSGGNSSLRLPLPPLLFTRPEPISHSLPIRSRTRRTNGGRLRWQGRRARLTPGELPSIGPREIRLSIRTLDLPSAGSVTRGSFISAIRRD